jgi:hypothetical protein
MEEEKDSLEEIESEEFGELLKYTGTGFAGGLIIGALLDYFGFQLSSIGQWIVRTVDADDFINFVEDFGRSQYNNPLGKSSVRHRRLWR